MKKLNFVLMIMMMAASVTSYAWYAKLSDPWSVIAKDDSLTVLWPDVNGLPINNACYTANEFKSLAGVEYCAKEEVTREACRYHGEVELCRMLKPGEEPGRCVEKAMKQVSVARTHWVQDCTKWEAPSEASAGGCLAYGPAYEVAYPTSFSVRIERTWSSEQGPQYFGNKQFDIPACAQ